MRLGSVIILSSFSSVIIACGGGSSTTPDAPVVNVGFNKPTAPLKANTEVSDDNWMELGAADMACLDTPNDDVATTVQVNLATVVRDFQSDNLVPNAHISVFKDQDLANPFIADAVADGNAAVTFQIPTGVKRFCYKMTDPESFDTLLLNQKVKPDIADQTEKSIRTVSKSTGATLPALIGISRTPGTGVLAGAIRDCQNHEISNFIATVTTMPARTYEDALANRVEGADSYYFSSSVGLPVRHTQKSQGSEDGLFMVVEIAPASEAYVQVWGYVTQADVDADNLRLIAELKTQSIADTMITGSYEPLRN